MNFMSGITRLICNLCKSHQINPPCKPMCDERELKEKVEKSAHLRHDVVDAKLQEIQFRLNYLDMEARTDFGYHINGYHDHRSDRANG